MALTNVNFECTQALGDLTTLTIEDTSTGSDGTITEYRVFLLKEDGTYLVPEGTTTDYIISDYPGINPFNILDVLDKDYALDITVQWVANTTVVYTKTILNLFRGYSETFLLNLTRFQTSNQRLVNSQNYFENKSKLRTLIDDAIQAVALGNDQTAAQVCLNAAKDLTDNEVNFY